MTKPLIIIGASTRAAAKSAFLAGFSPWCVDLFADRDLKRIAEVVRCEANRWPIGVLACLKDVPDSHKQFNVPVLFSGGMENHIDVVSQIAKDRIVIGPDETAMRKARHIDVWDCLRDDACMNLDGEHPGNVVAPCRIDPNLQSEQVADSKRRWLVKPKQGTNGRGISFWAGGCELDDGCYLEQYIEGTSVGAVVVVNSITGDAELLSVHEQIVGDSYFGASGFQFVGAIGPIVVSKVFESAIQSVATCAAASCGLTGVFGIDFIVGWAFKNSRSQDSIVVAPLEINPRYTAGVELWERATGGSALMRATEVGPNASASIVGNMIDAGIEADCGKGIDRLHGKAIVYALHNCCVPDLYEFFSEDQVADVPEIDTICCKGDPICTVFGTGVTRDDVLSELRYAAAMVYIRVKLDKN